MALPVNARSVALDVVKQFAPSEVIRFDEMWVDFEIDPDISRPFGWKPAVDRAHGAGLADAAIFLFTSIIIPVVVGLLKDKVKKDVDGIIAYIHAMIKPLPKRPASLDDAHVRELAEVIHKVTKQYAARKDKDEHE